MSLRAIFEFIGILFRYTDNPPELCIRKNEEKRFSTIPRKVKTKSDVIARTLDLVFTRSELKKEKKNSSLFDH